MLNYTLGTDGDNDKFVIDQKTGQITTSVKLNHETSDVASDGVQCETTNVCSVSVTATDSAGRTATATVTITIVNVDEPPAFLQTGNETLEVAENTTAVTGKAANDDDDYGAMDPESARVNLSLMGADRALFNLTGDNDLAFKSAPDFENPTDANKDNVYGVTVRATDGTLHTDRMVRVTVTPVDEAPVISAGPSIRGQSSIRYAENDTANVATYEVVGLEAGATVVWSLTGADAEDLDISSGELTFVSPPDFEDPADADTDNVYEVTVVAGDGTDSAMLDVSVTVTAMDQEVPVEWTRMTYTTGQRRNGRRTRVVRSDQ